MRNTKPAPGLWTPSLEPHESTGGSMMPLGDSDDYLILVCNDEAREKEIARLIAALHVYYRARDGEHGFLGSRGV